MKQLANKLGISESYYCSIENGERQKNMDMVLVSGIAEAFGISVAQVFDYEQEVKA